MENRWNSKRVLAESDKGRYSFESLEDFAAHKGKQGIR